MTCRECRAMLSALLDHELITDELQAVWHHLQVCPECAQECAQLCCMDAATVQACCPEAPETLWRHLSQTARACCAPTFDVRAFPPTEPPIEVTSLDERPFEVVCRELRWWFIVPEPGQRRRWATYDQPNRKLTAIDEMEVVGEGKVYGEACYEIRHRHYALEGGQTREAVAYGAIRNGAARWFGWWNLSDALKFFTWRDEHFEEDWGPEPLHIVDVGRYHWISEDELVEHPSPASSEPGSDSRGAGIWRLEIAGQSTLCLRVIDVTPMPNGSGILSEGFLDREGRVRLYRRYNAPHYPIDGRETREVLKGTPILKFQGVPYHLWYDCFPEDSLLNLPTTALGS